MYISRECI